MEFYDGREVRVNPNHEDDPECGGVRRVSQNSFLARAGGEFISLGG
jgi:hypothetical protein